MTEVHGDGTPKIGDDFSRGTVLFGDLRKGTLASHGVTGPKARGGSVPLKNSKMHVEDTAGRVRAGSEPTMTASRQQEIDLHKKQINKGEPPRRQSISERVKDFFGVTSVKAEFARERADTSMGFDKALGLNQKDRMSPAPLAHHIKQAKDLPTLEKALTKTPYMARLKAAGRPQNAQSLLIHAMNMSMIKEAAIDPEIAKKMSAKELQFELNQKTTEKKEWDSVVSALVKLMPLDKAVMNTNSRTVLSSVILDLFKEGKTEEAKALLNKIPTEHLKRMLTDKMIPALLNTKDEKLWGVKHEIIKTLTEIESNPGRSMNIEVATLGKNRVKESVGLLKNMLIDPLLEKAAAENDTITLRLLQNLSADKATAHLFVDKKQTSTLEEEAPPDHDFGKEEEAPPVHDFGEEIPPPPPEDEDEDPFKVDEPSWGSTPKAVEDELPPVHDFGKEEEAPPVHDFGEEIPPPPPEEEPELPPPPPDMAPTELTPLEKAPQASPSNLQLGKDLIRLINSSLRLPEGTPEQEKAHREVLEALGDTAVIDLLKEATSQLEGATLEDKIEEFHEEFGEENDAPAREAEKEFRTASAKSVSEDTPRTEQDLADIEEAASKFPDWDYNHEKAQSSKSTVASPSSDIPVAPPLDSPSSIPTAPPLTAPPLAPSISSETSPTPKPAVKTASSRPVPPSTVSAEQLQGMKLRATPGPKSVEPAPVTQQAENPLLAARRAKAEKERLEREKGDEWTDDAPSVQPTRVEPQSRPATPAPAREVFRSPTASAAPSTPADSEEARKKEAAQAADAKNLADKLAQRRRNLESLEADEPNADMTDDDL